MVSFKCSNLIAVVVLAWVRSLGAQPPNSFEPVSCVYIRDILEHLNPRKAVGVDGISPRLLRLSTPALAEEATNLIFFFDWYSILAV